MTDKSIIETKGLNFAYPNKVQALDNVTMDIKKGRKVVFLGPNGAGKSTLFLHFNGILRPKTGNVLFDGQEIKYDHRSLTALRENVGMVLQNPDDQIFSTTVEEDVAFGPLNLQLPRDEVERRVDDALHLVGMEGMRERPTQQLSFGQRKRVSLAGALAMRPKVLIMDEPTAGLDSEMVHELMELSDELNHGGMTMIMSTHDIETAYEWADEMKVMYKGMMIFSGTPEELFAQHDLVDKLRLVPPFPVLMNQQMFFRTGRPEMPYPRNLVELSVKCIPINKGPMAIRDMVFGNENEDAQRGHGMIYIIDINDARYRDQVKMISGHMKDIHGSSGAYGAKARRLVREGLIDVHHSFHALENAFLQVSLGNEFILYTDTSLISLVRSNLKKVEDKVALKVDIRLGSELSEADRPSLINDRGPRTTVSLSP